MNNTAKTEEPEEHSLSPKTFQWLIEQGFNPSDLARPGRYKDTPLIRASRQGRDDVVSDLLGLSASAIDLNHRNMDGTNALQQLQILA